MVTNNDFAAEARRPQSTKQTEHSLCHPTRNGSMIHSQYIMTQSSTRQRVGGVRTDGRRAAGTFATWQRSGASSHKTGTKQVKTGTKLVPILENLRELLRTVDNSRVTRQPQSFGTQAVTNKSRENTTPKTQKKFRTTIGSCPPDGLWMSSLRTAATRDNRQRSRAQSTARPASYPPSRVRSTARHTPLEKT